VAYYAGGATHFEQQDWLGTERMRTTYNGAVEGTFTSLPFGDGQATSGADTDANHYAQLDQDVESGTAHAQFRQYSEAQGRWLSPDPYSGSYNMSNPQSFNRYVYVGNNPLAAVDPTGEYLVDCSWDICGYSATVDGAPETVSTGLGSNMLAACPNNVCSYLNSSGQYITYQYMVEGRYYANTGPGSIYWSVVDAGTAAIQYSNPMAQAQGIEYSGYLYLDANGIYSYTAPQSGQGDGLSQPFNPGLVPSGTVYEGFYHDHASSDINPATSDGSWPTDEIFSSPGPGCTDPAGLCDIGIANSPKNNGMPWFLGTPAGRIEMYDPQQPSIVSGPGCVLVGAPVPFSTSPLVHSVSMCQ
jgi:RHS repeat-associated protein